jgi:hypothetical protein
MVLLRRDKQRLSELVVLQLTKMIGNAEQSLVDYVVVLVDHGKPREAILSSLEDYLGDYNKEFCDWLWVQVQEIASQRPAKKAKVITKEIDVVGSNHNTDKKTNGKDDSGLAHSQSNDSSSTSQITSQKQQIGSSSSTSCSLTSRSSSPQEPSLSKLGASSLSHTTNTSETNHNISTSSSSHKSSEGLKVKSLSFNFFFIFFFTPNCSRTKHARIIMMTLAFLLRIVRENKMLLSPSQYQINLKKRKKMQLVKARSLVHATAPIRKLIPNKHVSFGHLVRKDRVVIMHIRM